MDTADDSRLNDHRVLRIMRMLVAVIRQGFGVHGHAERMRRWCAQRYPFELLIDDFDRSILFYCCLDEHMGSQIFWRGAYSQDQLVFLRDFLSPEMLFLDVGANQGELTLFAAKRLTRGHVFAFEPIPRMADRLERNVAANGFDNVTLVRTALGVRTEEATLYSRPGLFEDGTRNDGLASFYTSGGRVAAVQKVAVQPLDEFVERSRLSRLDLVKIDVEGAERDVLSGARASLDRFRPILLLELAEESCQGAGYSTAELLQFVEGLGYAVKRLGRDGEQEDLHPDNLLPFQNAVCHPKP